MIMTARRLVYLTFCWAFERAPAVEILRRKRYTYELLILFIVAAKYRRCSCVWCKLTSYFDTWSMLMQLTQACEGNWHKKAISEDWSATKRSRLLQTKRFFITQSVFVISHQQKRLPLTNKNVYSSKLRNIACMTRDASKHLEHYVSNTQFMYWCMTNRGDD